ncbi:hypothetical protein V6N11_063416 [Hibiscus sabdariffa]|uniref:Uncharacterized protein n=2 Tax=Hibiscus sabdariffa TaxID=183260 RepID=A0ABR1ZUW3_9ROSI
MAMLEFLHELLFRRIIDALESKLKEASTRLELQLAEEQAAKWKAEEQANDLLKLKERSQKKLDEEIHRLLENLENVESQIIQMPKLSIL